MTPQCVAALVLRWVRIYTRDLPTQTARRRFDEIDADLHDHIAHEQAQGTGDRRIALGILSRMVRGLAADAAWRGRHVRATTCRSTARVALTTALLLAVPAVAMQVTDEVVWGPLDFAVAGILLMGTGLLHHLAARRAGKLAYRAGVVVALAAALLLVWSNLAVGIIGAPDEPANAMYAGVLAVGAASAVAARLRPAGMARALLATALAQTLVAVIALLAGQGATPGSSVAESIALNGLFVVLFAGSAELLRRAA